MKKNERLIQFFDMQVKGKTRARDITEDLVSPKTLNELISQFSSLRELNMARVKLSTKSKQEYLLADIEERDDCWVLLVNIVDAEAAHLVTNKMGGSDDDRKIISFDEESGLESSAHLVIFKEQDEAKKHLVLYEKNHSLSFARTISFLNKLAKVAAKHYITDYQKPHPSGVEDEYINLYCSLVYVGHPSEEFIEELENGVLTDIRLTSELNKIVGYDSNAHADLISHEIKMNVSQLAVKLSGGNWKHVKKAIQYGDSLESAFVRIQFKDATGPGHSATISTDTQQLVSGDKYVKKRRITGFGNSLQTAFPVIHEGIRDKMLGLML